MNTESIETGIFRVTVVRFDHQLNVLESLLRSNGVRYFKTLQWKVVFANFVAILAQQLRFNIVLCFESIDGKVGRCRLNVTITRNGHWNMLVAERCRDDTSSKVNCYASFAALEAPALSRHDARLNNRSRSSL